MQNNTWYNKWYISRGCATSVESQVLNQVLNLSRLSRRDCAVNLFLVVSFPKSFISQQRKKIDHFCTENTRTFG